VASQALLDGQDMKLTQKEFALLLVLAQSEGCTLSKEYLYEKVWQQPAGVDIQVVKTHLSKVRQKLKRARCGILIIALRGEGYMFMRYEQE
jgi:DNA-binding response OmpR family regulator